MSSSTITVNQSRAKKNKSFEEDPFPLSALIGNNEMFNAENTSFSTQSYVKKGIVGADGKKHMVKYATTTVGRNKPGVNGRILETRQAYSNSNTGVQKKSVERHVGDRGRKVIHEKKGEEERKTKLTRGMTDEGIPDFNKDFKDKAKSLPKHSKLGLKRIEKALKINTKALTNGSPQGSKGADKDASKGALLHRALQGQGAGQIAKMSAKIQPPGGKLDKKTKKMLKKQARLAKKGKTDFIRDVISTRSQSHSNESTQSRRSGKALAIGDQSSQLALADRSRQPEVIELGSDGEEPADLYTKKTKKALSKLGKGGKSGRKASPKKGAKKAGKKSAKKSAKKAAKSKPGKRGRPAKAAPKKKAAKK